MLECNFCKESKMNVGDLTEYGARIIFRIGDDESGWFATLSPKTGGDIQNDFCVQLMPIKHLKFFSDVNKNEELAKNYGLAFAKLSFAVGKIVGSEGRVPMGVYGKCKHPDEHIHLKIFPYRGDIGQPFTLDSSFERKQIFTGEEEYVKMKPIQKKYLNKEVFANLSDKLIDILNKCPIDLHVHTTASDGEFSPEQIVDYALSRDMKAIAITDHDTVAGVERAFNYAKEKDIEVVSGVEIGCDDLESEFKEIHIIGLFINPLNSELQEITNFLKDARIRQKKEIIEKLNRLGYEISFEELKREVGESFGRPHIAKILIRKYPEKFSDIRSVFDGLLGRGKSAYVEQERPPLGKVIKSIKNAGGIPILAHPGIFINNFEKIIERFVELGGVGVEVNYPYSKVCNESKDLERKLIKEIKEIAIRKGLLISGGSDYHGGDRPSKIGDGGIGIEEFEKLRVSRKHG